MTNTLNPSDTRIEPSKRCVFCSIVKEKSQNRIVWETKDLLCFFPLEPEVFGHTLIASKAHFADVRDAPISFGVHVFEASQFLASLYERKLGATGFNLLNASGRDAEQSIQHLHFHFFPRFAGDTFSAWPRLPKIHVDLDALLAQVRAV
ncbi:HIT family protein [Rhizobium sp.]|jgi:histidine triad (HIT) family protein|uniref:HIT family protein n=1 Tax=Rhizobium sp. TaxID=391 RepID=UPI002F1338A7